MALKNKSHMMGTILTATAPEAVVLAYRTRERAEARGLDLLTENMQLALRHAEEGRRVLKAETDARLGPNGPQGLRSVARDASHAWGGLYQRLVSASRLRNRHALERKPDIDRALAFVFDDGLKFQKMPYDLRWFEADRRLDRLHRDHEAITLEVAGRHFVEAVDETHVVFGQALHILEAPEDEETRTHLAPLTRKLMGYLRVYTVQGLALAELHPGQAELMAYLLEPIFEFQAEKKKARNRKKKATTETAKTKKAKEAKTKGAKTVAKEAKTKNVKTEAKEAKTEAKEGKTEAKEVKTKGAKTEAKEAKIEGAQAKASASTEEGAPPNSDTI